MATNYLAASHSVKGRLSDLLEKFGGSVLAKTGLALNQIKQLVVICAFR